MRLCRMVCTVLTGTVAPVRRYKRPAACALSAISSSERAPGAYHSNILAMMGCDGGIGCDNALAVRAQYVEIAERGLGRPDALLGFLLLALASFFRKIVDVVLCHQHLDAVEKFLG